jgi:hypothetical protein
MAVGDNVGAGLAPAHSDERRSRRFGKFNIEFNLNAFSLRSLGRHRGVPLQFVFRFIEICSSFNERLNFLSNTLCLCVSVVKKILTSNSRFI